MDNSKENQPVNIELSGEQAEVFDYQMDSDKEWFDSSHEWVFFFVLKLKGSLMNI